MPGDSQHVCYNKVSQDSGHRPRPAHPNPCEPLGLSARAGLLCVFCAHGSTSLKGARTNLETFWTFGFGNQALLACLAHLGRGFSISCQKT